MASSFEYRSSETTTTDGGDWTHSPAIPLFGLDIGGTLAKLVYFEPRDITEHEQQQQQQQHVEILKTIRNYLAENIAYGKNGIRDVHLEMPDQLLGGRHGTLHFIRFPTSELLHVLDVAKANNVVSILTNTMWATGGGAHKFEEDFKNILNLPLHKFDEFDCLVKGIHYVERFNPTSECYYWKHSSESPDSEKVPFSGHDTYPYLVVNIGTGVSMMAVRGPNDYMLVGGTSLGGASFLGLCCMVADCETFDEAMTRAEEGDSNKVDKLVKDVYGGDLRRFNIRGGALASSFGNMDQREKRDNASASDRARSVLVAITSNMGTIASLYAIIQKAERIMFVGNFLRENTLAKKLLSRSVEHRSRGTVKALFLEHEGYLGAIGCLLEYMRMTKLEPCL